jgi:hypothetical protein
MKVSLDLIDAEAFLLDGIINLLLTSQTPIATQHPYLINLRVS